MKGCEKKNERWDFIFYFTFFKKQLKRNHSYEREHRSGVWDSVFIADDISLHLTLK